MSIAVIGAGLAGSEAAAILASHYNLHVRLFEMKKHTPTPAQDCPDLFAELVCSNSLKSTSPLNPAGLLKNEITSLHSLIMSTARDAAVPAGESLSVDRNKFSNSITQFLRTHPNVKVHDERIDTLDAVFKHTDIDAAIVATGPLTADALAEDLRKKTESDSLYFYDAIAPILDGSTVDRSIAFLANRETRTQSFARKSAGLVPFQESDEGGDYLNLPLNKEQYLEFVAAVVAGDKVPFHDFEEAKFFNGCQPIEVLAESGPLTLAHGPMKGRGLTDPKTGRWPFAAVQLRKEKLGDEAYNMVGFQSRLTWTAQKQIFKTLPGLKEAEFFRMGSMHRNTYLVAPKIVNGDLSLKCDNRVWLAGQVMGVEGYLESAAMGCLVAHIVGHRYSRQKELRLPPPNTSLGCLARHCLDSDPKHYTPMNIHWGLFDELTAVDVQNYSKGTEALSRKKLEKSLKRLLLSRRSQSLFNEWFQSL